MKQTKSETKNTWKVVADEVLVDSSSFPATARTGSTGLNQVPDRLPPHKLLMAILLSALAAWCGAMAVHVGYDWGYQLIAKLIGQAAEASQGVMAFTSLICSIIPMLFGLFLGYFKAASSAKKSWTIAGTSVVLLFLALLVYSGNPPDFLIHPIRTVIQTVLGLGAFFAGLLGGQNVYRSLRERMSRPIRALLPAMVVYLPLAVASLLLNLDFRLELALYCLLTMLGALLSVRLSGAKRWGSTLSIALVSILPIALANLLNICGNLLSLSLDAVGIGAGLGWRALLSAVLISAVALSSALAGGLIGHRASGGAQG